MSAALRRAGRPVLAVNLLGNGGVPYSWAASPSAARDFIDPSYWIPAAQLAERGGFDALFLADSPAFRSSLSAVGGRLDPTVLWANAAAATESIGLVVTASSGLNDPYELAERLLSLDHLSGGRLGWNVVTTRDAPAYANFGVRALPPREGRYERAAEFVRTVRGLWTAADPARRVPVPESAQGHPVILQAGGSEGGRRLAGQEADGVFTAELTLSGAREHYELVKDEARRARRDPATVLVLPGLSVSIASSEAEAEARREEFDEPVDSAATVRTHAQRLGIDFSALDWDQPFPEHLIQDIPADPGFADSLGFRESVVRHIRERRPTVRQFLKESAQVGIGHARFAGTPEQLVDHIEHWFGAYAADGFTLMPDVLPVDLQLLVDEVVPLLVARGLRDPGYAGRTLRDHLGLQRP